jgi:hypothetical protein
VIVTIYISHCRENLILQVICYHYNFIVHDLFWKLTLAQLMNIFPALIKTKYSIPCSQKPVILLYHVSAKFVSYFGTRFHTILILSTSLLRRIRSEKCFNCLYILLFVFYNFILNHRLQRTPNEIHSMPKGIIKIQFQVEKRRVVGLRTEAKAVGSENQMKPNCTGYINSNIFRYLLQLCRKF